MMPWGHFAVAYLLFAPVRLLTDGRLPERDDFLVLLFASQLPDLIDKPLAWWFAVLPSGRMLAHSLVIALPLIAVVLVVAELTDRQTLGDASAVGYLSHIAADSLPLLWLGAEYHFLPNLFWPLLPANPDLNPGFIHHLQPTRPSVGLLVGGILFVIAWAFAQPEIQRDWFGEP